MNKTIKIYIVLLIFLFAGAAAIEFSREEPITGIEPLTRQIKFLTGLLFSTKNLKIYFQKVV